MSGGSYDYRYYTVEEYYVGRMYDIELNEMMRDLIEVLHDVEWWQSGDINEKDYRETVAKFKKKWFGRTKADIKKIIDEDFEKKKKELEETFGYLRESD